MDLKISDAIRQVTHQEGQSPDLAELIVAWFKNVASGNENIDNRQSAHRHLDHIFDNIHLRGNCGNAEDESNFDDESN